MRRIMRSGLVAGWVGLFIVLPLLLSGLGGNGVVSAQTPVPAGWSTVDVTLTTGANGTVDNLELSLQGKTPSTYAVMLDSPGDLQPGMVNTYQFTVPYDFCDLFQFRLTLYPAIVSPVDDWLGDTMTISINGLEVWYNAAMDDSGPLTAGGWRGGRWDQTAEYRSHCPMTEVNLTFVTGDDGTVDPFAFFLEGGYSASPYRYYADIPGDLMAGQTDTYSFLVPMDFCQMTGWRLEKYTTGGVDDSWLPNEIHLTLDGEVLFYDTVFYEVGTITAGSYRAGTWDGTQVYQDRCASLALAPGLVMTPVLMLSPLPQLAAGSSVITPIPLAVQPADVLPPVVLDNGQMAVEPPPALNLPPVQVQPGVAATLAPAPALVPPPAQGQQTTCPGFMASRLVTGQQGRVTPGEPNNLRAQASDQSARLGQIPGGGVFTVLAGPVCDPQGMAWWQVNYNGVVGWTSEGQGTIYWTEPIP